MWAKNVRGADHRTPSSKQPKYLSTLAEFYVEGGSYVGEVEKVVDSLDVAIVHGYDITAGQSWGTWPADGRYGSKKQQITGHLILRNITLTDPG